MNGNGIRTNLIQILLCYIQHGYSIRAEERTRVRKWKSCWTRERKSYGRLSIFHFDSHVFDMISVCELLFFLQPHTAYTALKPLEPCDISLARHWIFSHRTNTFALSYANPARLIDWCRNGIPMRDMRECMMSTSRTLFKWNVLFLRCWTSQKTILKNHNCMHCRNSKIIEWFGCYAFRRPVNGAHRSFLVQFSFFVASHSLVDQTFAPIGSRARLSVHYAIAFGSLGYEDGKSINKEEEKCERKANECRSKWLVCTLITGTHYFVCHLLRCSSRRVESRHSFSPYKDRKCARLCEQNRTERNDTEYSGVTSKIDV